jgi:putative membrane protein
MPRAERSHSTITLSIPSVVALILVPLLVAAGLIGTTWKMTDRLGQVKAAVVNEDAGVKLNGQQVPLGRQLSGGLIKSDTQTTDGRNISWELTDSSKASDGLKDGTYAAVVTIPKSFSKDATSYSANKADAANSARIDVKTSDSAPVTDTTIARMTAQAAEREMNKTLNSQYLDNIYIGFNKSANSMVSLAKGAKQLDTGAAGLKSGINQSTNGAYQLNNGMKQLDKGGQTLASNGSQLTTGVKQLSTGINALDTNGQKLAKAGTQLGSSGKQLSSGVSQLSSGLNQLDKQLQNPSSSSNSSSAGMSEKDLADLEKLKTGASDLHSGLKQQQATLNAYVDNPEQLPKDVREPLDGAMAEACGQPAATATYAECAKDFKAGIKTSAAGLGSDEQEKTLIGGAKLYSDNVAKGIDELVTKLKAMPQQIQKELQKQMKPLQDGIHQMATNTSKLSSGVTQYTNGVSQYTSGVSQYTAGVHKLNQQMPTLSSGISQYVSGVGTFADGVHQSAQGVDKFYDGQVQLSQGATKYAKGVNTFSTELQKGSKQVPTYSAADREKLSDVVSTPVNADTNPMGTSAWVVSLIVILGLWLGALAMWLVARTVPSRVLTSSKSSLKLLWSSMSTGALVTGISALGLTIIASLATDLSAGRTLGLFGMLLLVGAMCLAVNHALAAWLHAAGRFISLLFFIVAAAVGLVSAVPKPISTVHSISPLKPAMEGVTAILTGNAPSFGSFVTIILWLVIGGVASLLAVNRARRTSAAKVVGQLA